MHSLPIAANENLMQSTPTIVGGIRASATDVDSLSTPNSTTGGNGTGIVAAAPMLFHTASGLYFQQTSAAASLDAAAGLQLAGVGPSLFNGAAWDRQRNNSNFSFLASANRTAVTDSPTFPTFNAAGLYAILEVTGNPGGGETLTFDIRGLFAGGLQVALVAAPPIVAGVTSYALIQIGRDAAADPIAGAVSYAKSILTIPPAVFVRVNPSGAGVWTYSVRGAYAV